MLQQLGEDAKPATGKVLRHDLHLDRVAQVRFIRAIPQRRVTIGDLGPVGINLAPATEFLKHALQDRLDGVEHVLLFDKAHLQIQLVEVGWRAVRARILIPETRRDLEIFVKTRHHDQLFELLGRLGQRVEFARMQAGGHQEIPRAFGGGGGDDRRLILPKTFVPHPLADRGHHVRAQRHVLLHHLTPQIEVAIAKPRFLGIFLIAKHHEWQLCRLAQHL